MKSIAIILVAIGFVANPTSAVSINLRAGKPKAANSIISHARHDKIHNRTKQWKAFKPEDNPLYNLDDDQLKSLLGTFGLKENVGGELEEQSDADQTTLPTNYTSRTAACPGLIRNQGSCGSCWAFASSESLGDRYCRATNGQTNVTLSPEYLVTCDKNEMACSGGYLDKVFGYLTADGTVSEQCFPYVSANKFVPTCPSGCTNANVAFTKYKCAAGTTVHPTTVDAIKQEIYNNGPVLGGFYVYSDFYNYKSGIYKYVSGMKLGGHAIEIVGWGLENGINYWIVANSWGATWGEKGYFRIQMGQCGINDNIYACKPQL